MKLTFRYIRYVWTLLAMMIGLTVIGLLILSLTFGLLVGIFPVMVLLGPLMVLQYVYWRRQQPERTTWRYLQAEPLN